MIGDGDAMGVVAQIAERMLGASEGAFGVDVPVVSEQGEGLQVAMEAKVARPEVAFQAMTNLRRKTRWSTGMGNDKGFAHFSQRTYEWLLASVGIGQ